MHVALIVAGIIAGWYAVAVAAALLIGGALKAPGKGGGR